MALGVEPPDAPDVTNRGFPSGLGADETVENGADFRREEVEAVLREGAWREAFGEGAEYTDLNADEFRAVRDGGLFERLDFYWDPVDGALEFEVPSSADIDGADDLASRARGELSDLAETVVERTEDGYVDWGEGVSDDVWAEEGVAENAWNEGTDGDDDTPDDGGR